MDKGQEWGIKLVVTSKYPAKPLEFLEKALHQMSLLVGMPIDWPRIRVIAFGRNRIGGFLRINILPDRFRSIRLIAKDVAPCDFYLPEQGIACIESWSLPELSRKASGLPSPSTKVWIFVFLPPLDTPTALFSDFFSTIGTLMHLAGGRVDGDILKVGVHGQGLKNRFKHAHIPPLPKAAVYRLPRTIPLRKFSPRCPSSDNPQYPIHCTTVITFCWATAFPFFRVLWW